MEKMSQQDVEESVTQHKLSTEQLPETHDEDTPHVHNTQHMDISTLGTDEYWTFKILNDELIIKDEAIGHDEDTVEHECTLKDEADLYDQLIDEAHVNCEVISEKYNNDCSKQVEDMSHKVAATSNTYQCDLCKMHFATKSNLRRHIFRTHNENRTYKCKKTFKSKYNICMHSREKPYKCNRCDNSYASRSSRKRHFMSEEETQEIMEEAPWHVRRWVQDLPGQGPSSPEMLSRSRVLVTASATSDVNVATEVDVRPSTSGLTVLSSVPRCNYGSDLDSEHDDEFNFEAGPSRRGLPNVEELEEPIQEFVTEIDTGMDNVADHLLGTSASFTWVSDFESFRGIREKFSGPAPGPLKDYDSPYDAFIDIWDKDIIELIVLETNRYAQQTIEAKLSRGILRPSSRLRSWTDTNSDEIMTFFAILMYMAIDSRTSVTEYWTKNEALQLPGFQRLMTYNRYILLSKFLHFVDNTADASQQLPPTGDSDSVRLSAKLNKMAPIVKHLDKKFKSLYNLGPNLSIDESLTLFKGRLSWVQTIRSKAARFGIKSYELCESDTGYMAGFQIYTGKGDGPGGDSSLGVNLGGKSTKVVVELLQGLERRGHCVVMHNFYNCPSLARYLKSLGFDCFGTLRVCRRNVPSDIAKVPRKVNKGTIISRHSGDVSIIAWMDFKMVNIISTFHRPDTYIGTKAGKTNVKPVCVKDYNECMGGVDFKDQKLATYVLERKRGVKWYIKMFKRLLNVSIYNALVMFVSSLKRRDKLPVTHREFRYGLAEALLRRHRPVQVEISQPVGNLMRLRRDIVHEPQYLAGAKNRRRCVLCYRQGAEKTVHSKCVQCEVYLCFVDCFRIWHSEAVLPGGDARGRKRKCKK